MASSPIGSVLGGTLSPGATGQISQGNIVVDTGGNLWLPWNQAQSYPNCIIGICVTNAVVPGGPIQVLVEGALPYAAFNIGPGNPGYVVAGNTPTRGTVGTIIGTCDPAGSVTLYPSVVGKSANLSISSRPTVVHVKDNGAVGNGTTDDSSAILAAAAAAVGASPGIVYFDSGTYLINSNITLPSGVVYQFNGLSSLSVGSGHTVTFAGQIDAPTLSQIFSGLGTIAFAQGSQPFVWADWWGTSNLQLACNAAHPVGIEVRLNNTTYNLGSGTNGLVINNHNARLIGVSESQTGITSQPSAGGPVLTYTGTGTAVFVGDVSIQYFGIVIENIYIQPALNSNYGMYWYNTVDSIGRRIRIFGQTGTANYCCRRQFTINCPLEDCDFHGGAGGGPDFSTAAVAFLDAESTTSPCVRCYFHYSSTAFICAGSNTRLVDCILESSQRSIYTNSIGKSVLERCWIENCGSGNSSGAYYESAGYTDPGSTLWHIESKITMYPTQLVAFQAPAGSFVRVKGGEISAGATFVVTNIATGSNPTVTISTPWTVSGNGTFYVLIMGVNGLTGASGTWPITWIDSTHFSLNGATTSGTFSGSAVAEPIPFIFRGDVEEISSDVEITGLWLHNPYQPFMLIPPSIQIVTGDAVSWRQLKFPQAQQTRLYTFIQKSVAAGVGSGDMATASGYADNSVTMDMRGYILGSNTYSSKALTGGTVRTQVYRRESTLILADTLAVGALPAVVDRSYLSAPLGPGDVLAVNYDTSAGFSPNGAGQDLVCEVRIATGDVSPAPFRPDLEAGCKLWLSPDRGVTLSGAQVTSWADMMGHTATFTNTGTNLQIQPINGQNTIWFMSTDSYLSSTTALSSVLTASAWTAVAVFLYTGGVTEGANPYTNPFVIGDPDNKFWGITTSTTKVDVFQNDGAVKNDQRTTSVSAHYLVAKYDGSKIYTRLDGGSWDAGTSAGNIATTTGALRIGKTFGGVTNFMGNIGDIALFNGTLSDAAVNRLMAGLQAKWRI